MIVKAVDNSSETTTYYYHDFSGGLICEYRQTEGGDLSYYFSYDAEGNRVEKTSINGQTKTITSGTDDDGKSFVSNDGVTAESTTDDFGRTTEVKTSLGEGRPVFFTNYEYANVGTIKATTNLVGEITQKYGSDELVKYQYTYDGNGNIEQVRENGVITAKYSYDELNQLVWSGDKNTNLYTQMVYDNAGNITRVDIYSLGSNWAPVKLLESRTYTYGDTNWCDKLTGYNGTTITYDAVGNPLSYRDGMTMSWQNGRQLAALQTADNSVAYKYDSNGMRTRKSDNNGTTNYYYDSNNNLIGLTKGNNTLLFYYNPSGDVTSFKYNSEMYYYIKNLQGDIVKIIDQSGAETASYKYDSWGKITAESGSSVIRELNPFRYRGYVYDTETGLYYLQSRYYDPITGRFLNADDTQYINNSENILGENLFTYCYNQYVMKFDITGNKGQSKSVYNRYKAVNYAKKYYRGHNSEYKYFPKGDCANFVSQCIHEGGIKFNNKWYHKREQKHISHERFFYTKTWTCVPEQYNYFKSWGFTKYIIKVDKKTTLSKYKQLIKRYNIRKGDLIYMDFDGDGHANHATMISSIDKNGNIKYTGHTNPQFDQKISNVFNSNKKCIMKIFVLV